MLKLVIPKGSLEEKTLELFERADLNIVMEGKYDGIIDDPRISQVKILRPQEIPIYIQEGVFDLGITGQDWIHERGAGVIEVADLLYSKKTEGKVRIVLAVTEDSDIKSSKDIIPGSKITTEYPQITEAYFKRLGIPVRIYESYGATEAKVPQIADAAVELIEKGETLRMQRLRVVDVIMESITKLIANKDSYDVPEKRKAIDEIKILLLGVIQARGRVLLKMNVKEDDLHKVIRLLPSLKSPTVSPLYEVGGSKGEWFAVETIVEKSGINLLITRLKGSGAQGIIEIPINKMVL